MYRAPEVDLAEQAGCSAPEIEWVAVTPKSDVYSFGRMLCQLAHFCPALEPWVGALADLCCATDPASRPPMRAVAEVLKHAAACA
jgi:hypothetical protein